MNETLEKLETLCLELHRRQTLNRPFDAETLIATLLLIAESLKETMSEVLKNNRTTT